MERWKLSKFKIAVLVLMAVLTIIYVGVVVYANANSNGSDDEVYAAFEYVAETPPIDWYTTEQLGIIKVIEYGQNSSHWLHVVVDREKEPFPLQREQPIFLYKDEFYRVAEVWVTPGLPEQVRRWQIPIGATLGVGWFCTGALLLKESVP